MIKIKVSKLSGINYLARLFVNHGVKKVGLTKDHKYMRNKTRKIANAINNDEEIKLIDDRVKDENTRT